MVEEEVVAKLVAKAELVRFGEVVATLAIGGRAAGVDFVVWRVR